MGLHSALAIKRQRKRRQDMKRAKGRRYSIQSMESGLAGSQSSFASPRNSIDGDIKFKHKTMKNKVTSFESNVGIGMLQIGVVFVVLGVFLLGSTLIPDNFDDWSWQNIFTKKAWWNELVITGAFALLLGVFLIVLDKFISKKEEEDLNEYVQGQLTRSRSGRRLVRDLETGNLVPKRSRTMNAINDKFQQDVEEDFPEIHSPKIKSPPATANHVFMNGETGTLSPQLEKIMEEDISPMMDHGRIPGSHTVQEEYESTTASMSPGSGFETQETQELIGGAPHLTHQGSNKYQQVRRTKI